jgi:hypothetical protein
MLQREIEILVHRTISRLVEFASITEVAGVGTHAGEQKFSFSSRRTINGSESEKEAEVFKERRPRREE